MDWYILAKLLGVKPKQVSFFVAGELRKAIFAALVGYLEPKDWNVPLRATGILRRRANEAAFA